MTLLHRLLSIVGWLLRRQAAEDRLDDELRAFVDMSVAERIRAGVPAPEARRQALLELGGLEQVKEQVRTRRHGAILDELGRDVRYAIRAFARTPGFTAVVLITLALGIGANTAIFGLIDALMLRWLPVHKPQELQQIALQGRDAAGPAGATLSYVIIRALADQHDIFSGVAGFSGFAFEVGTPGSVSRVSGALVTGGFYETLGLRPVLGRLLTDADDERGAPLAAVVSYGFWERQLGSDARAIGQTIRVNGVPVTVVGVSPRGFAGANVGAVADITMPAGSLPLVSPGAAPLLGSGNFWMRALARPKPGVSAVDAAARLNARWPGMAEPLIAAHWPASRRTAIAESVFRLTPGGTGWTYLRSQYRLPLLVLMAAVGLVLLIACANVASLQLARAATRQREIALRLAIGAGRGRIARQLLVESTLLSLMGAALGVCVAWVSSQLLVSLIASEPPLVFDLTPNRRVVAFAVVMAVVTGILFGLAPAVHATAVAPGETLKSGGRSSGSPSRLLPWLVSGQVALSLVLLGGAGLFVRTLQNLQAVDPGFHRDGVWLVDLEGRRAAAPAALLERARHVPGVVSASLSTHTPLSGSLWSEPAVPVKQPVPERDNAHFIGAGPGFFATMQIRLLAGREFDERDGPASAPVAVVNEAFAQRYFGRRNPVGERLSARVRGARQELEIVGLSRNTSTAGLREAPPPTVYVAYAQLTGDFPTTLVARLAGPQRQTAAALQATMQAQLPDTVLDVKPLAAQVDATLAQERLMATLASGFAGLALTVAAVGLYGLLAYGVAQRTREIGIRMALGAGGSRVIGMVVGRGMRLVLIGIAVGTPAAWAASRWVQSMLFGLTPTDPAATGIAISLLVAAGLVAAYLPARRASRVDPLNALRYE